MVSSIAVEASGSSEKYVMSISPILSRVGYWHDDYLRPLMQDANLWIKGNTSHRFRDSAVDYWLGEGWSMTEVAAALGDSLAVTEKHYADLASKRMQERLRKLPIRRWENCE